MIEEFYRKHLDVIERFELWNIDVLTLRDVKEHTVQKEKESFNIKVLSPT